MSIQTFKVRSLTEKEKDNMPFLSKFGSDKPKLAGPCWLCGAKTSIHKWADHAERHRKQGWKPRPADPPKRPAEQVFAEWQQADTTPEDYGSLAEYRRLTGRK